MRIEMMVSPAWAELCVDTPSSEPARQESQDSPDQAEQPTADGRQDGGARYSRGSFIKIATLKRPFLERRWTSSKTVKPGRAPGRDLTGADLIGAVGTIKRTPDAQPDRWSTSADPLLLVRVDDEDLYLNQSEIVPFEPNPSRD